MRRGDCICEWSRGAKRGMYIIFLFGTNLVGCIAICHGIAFFCHLVVGVPHLHLFLVFGLGFSFTIVLLSLILAWLVD